MKKGNILKIIENITINTKQLEDFLATYKINGEDIKQIGSLEVSAEEVQEAHDILAYIFSNLENSLEIQTKSHTMTQENKITEYQNVTNQEVKTKGSVVTEHNVKEAFLKNIRENLAGIKRGYETVMIMYIIAFSIGIVLIGASLYSAFILKENVSAFLFGGLGTVDIVGSLIFRPAQELQNSRGGLVQLTTAYFGWINDLNNWNSYLKQKEKMYGIAPFEEVMSASKQTVENLSSIARVINYIYLTSVAGKKMSQKNK